MDKFIRRNRIIKLSKLILFLILLILFPGCSIKNLKVAPEYKNRRVSDYKEEIANMNRACENSKDCDYQYDCGCVARGEKCPLDCGGNPDAPDCPLTSGCVCVSGFCEVFNASGWKDWTFEDCKKNIPDEYEKCQASIANYIAKKDLNSALNKCGELKNNYYVNNSYECYENIAVELARTDLAKAKTICEEIKSEKYSENKYSCINSITYLASQDQSRIDEAISMCKDINNTMNKNFCLANLLPYISKYKSRDFLQDFCSNIFQSALEKKNCDEYLKRK